MTTKEAVEKIIHGLPNDASIDDINYHLYVYEKIEQANESERIHGLISNKEAKERVLQCLRK